MSETSSSTRIGELIRQLARGERFALNELVPLVYSDLRRMARAQLARERPGHTLDSVALVNEAFLALAQGDDLVLEGRAHFFGISANVMRRILVDYARARNAAKRGGGAEAILLEEAELALPAAEAERVLALDACLEKLAMVDEVAVSVVERRYFADATEEEIAGALGISKATVRRKWAFAKAWLNRQLGESR